MQRVSIICTILALATAQSGYDYNKPNRQFASTSSRPGSPGPAGTTTPYPIRPQNDDYNGGHTPGYPGQQSHDGQREHYPGPHTNQGPSGSSLGNYQGQGSNQPTGSYSGHNPSESPLGYPGHGHSTSSPGFPGPSDSSFQGPHSDSGFHDHRGSSFPGHEQNYPEQSGPNFGVSGFAESNSGHYQNGDYSAIPGQPDIDYPILSYIPQTSFDCKAQPYPGYYADVEARCQVFHVCANNRTYDFLCPNGTIFSQEDFVCVWWNQFSCNSAPSLYELNAKIYDYSIKGSSDFSVPGFNDFPDSFPGRGQGSYPSAGTPRPSTFSNHFGPQGPTTPFPGHSTPSYSSSQAPGNFPGFQGLSDSNPGTQGGNYPGSYPSGTQGSTSSSSYPGSTSSHSDSHSNQGYPSGRPSGFTSSSGRPIQKPDREYLPPRN